MWHEDRPRVRKMQLAIFAFQLQSRGWFMSGGLCRQTSAFILSRCMYNLREPDCLQLYCTDAWHGQFCMQVVNQFDELVEEGHAARDALLKNLNKKITRTKNNDAGASSHLHLQCTLSWQAAHKLCILCMRTSYWQSKSTCSSLSLRGWSLSRTVLLKATFRYVCAAYCVAFFDIYKCGWCLPIQNLSELIAWSPAI